MANWALEAIEREAMNRAERLLATVPRTFTYMGVQERQLAWLIVDYEIRNQALARDLDPEAPHAG